MKIIKVLGVVAGIHGLAILLIFANPGCSSTAKPTPAPVDTMAKSEPAPAITVPGMPPAAAPGVSPLSIAPMAFNPDAPAMAGDGRFTPTRPGTAAASTLVAAPVANVVPVKTYAVKSGDSLWTIAHKNDLTVAELAAANNLGASAKLHEGQKLILPGKSAAPVAPAPATAATTKTEPAPKPSAEFVKHTVKAGETLSSIAKNYGVKQSEIAVANNITDPRQVIRAGAVLIIPGWKATADKNGKSPAKTPAKGGTAKPAGPPDVAPGGGQVPIIGPGSATPEIPIIKMEDPSAMPKKS